mmetsp:Transcript_33233/g.82251  ORF Transcript_33233/g.82251 Transcript_33233/m.82251 type:complete len:83 (-) Transcript_33233:2-250(-)
MNRTVRTHLSLILQRCKEYISQLPTSFTGVKRIGVMLGQFSFNFDMTDFRQNVQNVNKAVTCFNESDVTVRFLTIMTEIRRG